MYKKFIKRFIDIILSISILFFLSPVFLFVWLAIRLDSAGPAIFRQRRIGYKGKIYEILKFRSMYIGAEKSGTGVYSEKGDARVTRIGRILRATSLDELPQAWNILRGDMSFIGPRPPLTYHPWPFENYTMEQRRMFDIRPGITGWAQINGRKALEWHKRIEFNVWYVEHISFSLDLKIFFLTIFKVLANTDNVNNGKTV